MESSLNIKEIVRVESKGLNTYLFFAGGYNERVDNSIDELEKEFAKWSFVRIHPQHLINMIYYKKVSTFSSPAIEMNDGTLLPANANLININQFANKHNRWWQKILQIIKMNNHKL